MVQSLVKSELLHGLVVSSVLMYSDYSLVVSSVLVYSDYFKVQVTVCVSVTNTSH